MSEQTKVCTKCGNTKLLIDYYQRYNQCKTCCNSVAKSYRESNKYVIKERRKKKYWDNPQAARKAAKEYMENNPSYKKRCITRLDAYYQQHKDRIAMSRRDRLTDSYVRLCFNLPHGHSRFLSADDIEIKRIQIKVRRVIKQFKQEIKNG